MSAANFYAMENFPLYVIDFDEEAKRCPACGLIHGIEDERCEECGSELERCIYYDGLYAMEICGDIEERLDELNDDLLFHTVKLRRGYYCGMQFYVEMEYDTDSCIYDDDDCYYYFGCNMRESSQKYAEEVRKVNQELNRLAEEYGFTELVCVARFSNGEAIYEKAESLRARIYSVIV